MAHLRELGIPHGDSDSYDINAFLEALRDALRGAPDPTSHSSQIFELEVAYKDKTNQSLDVERQMTKFHTELREAMKAAEQENDPYSQEEVDIDTTKIKEIRADLENYGLVTNAAKFYAASKINYYLLATPPNMNWEKSHARRTAKTDAMRQKLKSRHYQRLNDWHAFAIRIENGNMFIYDPSFTRTLSSDWRRSAAEQYQRIGEYQWMSKAMQLRSLIDKRGKKIREIWMGGGGNKRTQCQEMACNWLRGEVMKDLGDSSRQVAPQTDFHWRLWQRGPNGEDGYMGSFEV